MAMVEPASRGERSAPRWWLFPLHVFVLANFAITQPLLQTLGKNPTFFVAHDMGRLELVVFVISLLIVPTLLFVGLCALVRLASSDAARMLELVVIGTLIAFVFGPAVTKTFGAPTALAAYCVLGLVGAFAYARSGLVRRFLTFLVIGPIVMIAFFFLPSSRSAFFSNVPETARVASALEDPPSVVFVMLDELALNVITDRDGDIDEKRFPNFARLADRSTWYPNATTNSNITSDALPALLTGRYPREGNTLPPIRALHPHNLFTLLQHTHDLHVHENISALCPDGECGERLQRWGSTKHVVADSALVYAHLAFPRSIAHRLPEFGVQWGGFFASPLALPERVAEFPAVVRPIVRPVLTWLADDELGSAEVNRLRSFAESITPSGDPGLWFFHSMIPHSPWHLLPDGRVYDYLVNPGWIGGRWVSDEGADAAYQRYVLQTQATDGFIGDLMDRLERDAKWDDTMLIVQSDHGALFRKGAEHRSVRGSPPDLLRIPLFIKYPGQRKGRVDEGVAELIDIVPTIADVVGVDLPWDADGTSLRDKDRRKRPRHVWEWARRLEDPVFDEDDFGYGAARITKLFGRRGGVDDIFAWGPHRSLVGSKAPDERPPPGATATVERLELYADVVPETTYAPARVVGTVEAGRWRWVAVALNGRIAGLGMPYVEGASTRFAVMVSPRLLDPGRNVVSVYGVRADGALVPLGGG